MPPHSFPHPQPLGIKNQDTGFNRAVSNPNKVVTVFIRQSSLSEKLYTSIKIISKNIRNRNRDR